MRHRPRGAIASKEKDQRNVYRSNHAFSTIVTRPNINTDRSNLLIKSDRISLEEYIGVGTKLGKQLVALSKDRWPFYCSMYFNSKLELQIEHSILQDLEWDY